MPEYKCPYGHILTKIGFFSTNGNRYGKFSCLCKDQYIYAPDINKSIFNVKNKFYKIINLTYLVKELNDGLNYIKQENIYRFKFTGNKIDIAYCCTKKCPKCNAELKRFQLVDKKDNIVPMFFNGRYCDNCKIPYFKEEDRINLRAYDSKCITTRFASGNCCYLFSNEKGRLKKCLWCGNSLELRRVAYDKTIENSTNFIEYQRCSNCDNVFLNNEIYSTGNNQEILLKILESEAKIKKKNKKKKKAKTNELQPKKISEVVIYRSINNTCKNRHKESVEQIPLDVVHIKTKKVIRLNGFHCKKCNKNFITLDAIERYTSIKYMPQFKCTLSSDFSNKLNDVSMLALYGYTVKADYLSKDERHDIIDYVIENKIMTPLDVIHLLEFNIKFKSNNLSMKNAISKWEDDIRYVYKIK